MSARATHPERETGGLINDRTMVLFLRRKFILFDDTKEERDEGKAMLNWHEFFTGIDQQQVIKPWFSSVVGEQNHGSILWFHFVLEPWFY